MSGTIAITMAGLGSRFQNKGFLLPKYQIEVFGFTLFEWSIISLKNFHENDWKFSFAVRSNDRAEEFIKQKCRKHEFQIDNIITLDTPTDGQATTANLIAQKSNKQEPFAVFNIDTLIHPDSIGVECIPKNIQGWIPCFKGVGNGWSFAKIDNNGKLIELREKERISDLATLGFYWFESADFYTSLYNKHFLKFSYEKGERYIAPMYNSVISSGGDIRIFNIDNDDVAIFGTPEQVEEIKLNKPKCIQKLINFI